MFDNISVLYAGFILNFDVIFTGLFQAGSEEECCPD